MFRLFLIAVGFFSACVFTQSVTGAVVYRNVIGQGDVVEFDDGAADWCPIQGALKVTWFVKAGPRKGETVRGCYLERGGNIMMVFEDGDQFVVPVEKIRQLHQRQGT